MGFAAAAGSSTSGYSRAMIDTAYGTSPYQTQYEIGDLLGKVAADVSAQLEQFLSQALEGEAGDRVDEGPIEREIVSAH